MKYAWITGTSSGLGKAFAELLLEKGWSVTGIGRNKGHQHPAYHHLYLDLSEQTSAESIHFQFENASEVLLINNAGNLGEIGWMGKIADQPVRHGLILNLVSPAILCNRFLKQTQIAGLKRSILNISSGAAQNPYDGWAMYCSSKAGLDMLSETIALERKLAGDTLTRIFSVAPGVIDTPMQDTIRKADPSGFSLINKFVGLHRDGMLGSPENAARQLIGIVEEAESFPNTRYDIRELNRPV